MIGEIGETPRPRDAGAAAREGVLTLEAPPLRLVFRWEGDRWAHAIESGGRVLARSLEWDAAHGDPSRVVSPAYQQHHEQPVLGGAEALLVGQWGRHHFSAVFRVVTDADGAGIGVDVAARSLGPLEALAATYRVPGGSAGLIDAGPEGITWEAGPGASAGRLRLEPVAVGGAAPRLVLAESGRSEARVQVDVPVLPGPTTRRLAYRWLWLP